MDVCTKIWAAIAVLMFAGSCVLARPSERDASDEHRESRTSNGFKYVTSPLQWAYLTANFVPKYMHHDISPLVRHETTPPSLLLPYSWFYHSSAEHNGLGPNKFATENQPSLNFGLPYFKKSPPTSNLYMVFNGRLSTTKDITKQAKDKNKQISITPDMHNSQSFLNSLDGRPHHMENGIDRSNFVKNTLLLQSRPSQDEDKDADIRTFNNRTTAVVTAEVNNNKDPVVTSKLTAQTSPELTHKFAESVSDSASPAVPNAHNDEGHRKLLPNVPESLSGNSKKDVNASQLTKPTTLVLKPVAKAVAGPEGIAIAAPISRAVVRKGQDVNIHFEPEAVAVVGPGGIADAHSKLFVSYYEDLSSQDKEKS